MDMSEILAEIDDHGFVDTSSTRKVSAVNDAYWDICAREEWPFLEAASTTIATVSSQSFIAMPVDFARVIAVSNPAGAFTLLYEDYETLAKLFPSLETTTGTPLYYYFVGTIMHFYPVPNAVISLRFRYVKWPSELSVNTLESGIVIPARHQRAIVIGALVKLYSMEDDLEQALAFRTQFEERIQNMREDLLKRHFGSSKNRKRAGDREDGSR